MANPEDGASHPAIVESNGLVDSWLVSINGYVVLTGCTRQAADAYAKR